MQHCVIYTYVHILLALFLSTHELTSCLIETFLALFTSFHSTLCVGSYFFLCEYKMQMFAHDVLPSISHGPEPTQLSLKSKRPY